MNEQSQSLIQLITKVRDGIRQQFGDQQWVVAEISDININRTGHCYLELIEKDDVSQKIIAKTRATIWAFAFRMIKPYFETATKEQLRAGIKVMLKVSVEFHELYGFSLNVQDIDPQYTLGDMARKRAEIIDRLSNEGVIELNKEIPFPMVPQHIAIVSSETAAGYGDFINQIKQNPEGFAIHTELFPAVMQGDKTAESVSSALYAIFDRQSEFDAVAIIRGGGAKSELSSFDDYELAFAITQFPIPVLTGIGHERDESIVDLVAHTKLKTPTAVAEYLVDCMREFASHLEQLEQGVFALAIDALDEKSSELSYFWERINHVLRDKMDSQIAYLSKVNQKLIGASENYLTKSDTRLNSNKEKMAMIVKNKLTQQTLRVSQVKEKLKPAISHFISNQEQMLSFADSKSKLLDPQVILNRGYAYVTHSKGVLRDEQTVAVGDEISVQLAKGKIGAQVKSKHK